MKYETAKQLKDAGWPQVGPLHHDINPNELADSNSLESVDEPTLSELIEACGDEVVLEHVNSEGLHPWTAGTFIDHDGEIEKAFTAETPEEAVAKLWLALHTSTSPAQQP